MSTYTQILYQIVFSPKHRAPVLLAEGRPHLYAYIAGIIRNKNSIPFQLGGISDHIHIITHIHPSVALASLVKDIKLASHKFILEQKLFPGFEAWQVGYGAFTYSLREKDRLIAYVQNQEEHHRRQTFYDEYHDLLLEHGIAFDEKYFLNE